MKPFLGLVPLSLALAACGPASAPKLRVLVPSNPHTSEKGGATTIELTLTEAPSQNVTLQVWSSDETEGVIDQKLLTFRPEDWDGPHIVKVTGVDDPVKDGAQRYEIGFGDTESDDLGFVGVHASPVSIVNDDDDSPGIVAELPTLEKSLPPSVSEGGTTTVSVRLTSKPSASVTVDVPASLDSRLSFSPTQLVFYPLDWDKPQAIGIAVSDDHVIEGDRKVPISFARAQSDDVDYAGFVVASPMLLVEDKQHASIAISTLSPSALVEGELGTFSVMLTGLPTSNVKIPLAHTSNVTLNLPPELLFTPANWNVPQIVDVKPVYDGIAQGARAVTIFLLPMVSSDPFYSGFDPADVTFQLTDN